MKYILFALSLCFAACGGSSNVGPFSTTVGAACSSNAQCMSLCVNNGDFPGGMCTERCAANVNCPAGTVCIDEAGGICAVSCVNNGNCTGFGPMYICDGKSLVQGGSALICRSK